VMDVNYKNGGAILRGLDEFEPGHIFDNGQCFRFIRQDGWLLRGGRTRAMAEGGKKGRGYKPLPVRKRRF
jgi:hypothetical protein